MTGPVGKGAKAKSRLGRGLSSLISVSTPSEPETIDSPAVVPPVTERPAPPAAIEAPDAMPGDAIAEIPLSEIVPNPHQPRRVINEASIAELAASIKSTGLIQPLIVRRAGQGYQIIAGERRWRASKLAGLVKVPVVIRDVDSFTQAQMALIENIQREDLNPIDRALGYRTLIDQLGLTQAELAGRLGEDRSSIANFLRLLELSEPVRNQVRDGALSVGHAKLLAGVGDPAEQQRLAELVISQGLSVRNLERMLQQGASTPPPTTRSAPPASAHIQDLEKTISRQLGLRVQLKTTGSKAGRGKLILHYSSLDQFDDLLTRLNVSPD